MAQFNGDYQQLAAALLQQAGVVGAAAQGGGIAQGGPAVSVPVAHYAGDKLDIERTESHVAKWLTEKRCSPQRSGGEHCFYAPKRKAPPMSATGVRFLLVMSFFDTTSYHTRKKPKPPLIRKNHALAQIFSEALTVTLTGSRPSSVPAEYRPGQALGPPSLPTKFKTIRADCTARSANHYGDAGVR